MRKRFETFAREHADVLLALAFSSFGLLDLVLSDPPIELRLLYLSFIVASGIAAAQRIRAPLVLLTLMFLVTAVSASVPQLKASSTMQSLIFLFLLSIYTAAAHTNGRSTVVAGTMVAGIALIDLAADPAGITAEGVVFYSLMVGLPWAVGRAVRGRRLKEQQLEIERMEAAAAIVDERARIARELHDVVAHSISVIVLQARGGRRVLRSDPDDAREAFVNIERAGEQSLDEMRRLLGMLRSSDEALPLAPQPSLRHLDTLVEHVRAAGLPVDVLVQGEPRDLPPGVDLSAFRVIQEALTNALKHAGQTRARVVVRYGPDALELEVADDGSGTKAETVPGYGLVGMRERVSVYGGELEAGRRPEGGYALRVRLPLGSARA